MISELTGTPPEIRYRVVVGGLGIVFDGCSESDGRNQYRIFVIQSTGESVALFKGYEIMQEFHPNGRSDP